MKRYWKLVAITLVVIISISTYYLQSAASANLLPQFIIEKQIGSQKEAEGISLYASYSDGTIHDNVKITTEGSHYNSEMSFFDRMKKFGFYSVELQGLQNKYYNFMRGKNDPNGLYDDQNQLVYATIVFKTSGVSEGIGNGYYSFEITSLIKKDKNESSFTLSVPNTSKYSSVYVNDVQMIDNQLNVTTTNNVSNRNENDINDSEVHVYSFDIAHKQLLSDETIFKNPKLNHHMESIYNMIPENEMFKPNHYIFFNHVVSKLSTQGDGSISPDNVKEELLAYNYKTKKVETITLPKESNKSDAQIYNGSTLFLSKHNPEGITILAFSAEKKKVEKEYKIPVPKIDKELNNITMKNKHNKLYILTPYDESEQSASLFIINQKTKAALFEGKVYSKYKKKENLSLSLYDLEVLK